jgi:hypothetical protein
MEEYSQPNPGEFSKKDTVFAWILQGKNINFIVFVLQF